MSACTSNGATNNLNAVCFGNKESKLILQFYGNHNFHLNSLFLPFVFVTPDKLTSTFQDFFQGWIEKMFRQCLQKCLPCEKHPLKRCCYYHYYFCITIIEMHPSLGMVLYILISHSRRTLRIWVAKLL